MAVAKAASELIIKQEPPDSPVGPADQVNPVGQVSPVELVPHEPVNPVQLEERILELCAEHPKGITDEIITRDQPLISGEARMRALQRLLSMGKLDLFKQGSTLIYKLKPTSSVHSKTKECENIEEKLIYQFIEDSGNKGIWIRDIRIRSNLAHTQVVKILKTLESKKLIKSVKSVQASKKKVYMLSHLEPHESVTGGAWYSDQEFETKFVDVLNQQCLRYLQQKAFKAQASHSDDPLLRKNSSMAAATDVHQFISELGVSKVELTPENIDSILCTLVYDGLVEETVMDHCCDGGAISPSTCVYLKKWMQF